MAMFSGRQLLLLRRRKRISLEEMAKCLELPVNELTAFEYALKPIPQHVYEKWLDRLK